MFQVEDDRQRRTENTLSITITKEVMKGKADAIYNSTVLNVFEILSNEENSIAQPVDSAAAMK
jgi:maleate cis-trans isomerase